MLKFPSIDQFRNVIRSVQLRSSYAGNDEDGQPIYIQPSSLPTIKFVGTTKIHGTNAGIVYDVSTKALTFQSRERILSAGSDNAGFFAHCQNHISLIQSMFDDYCSMPRETSDDINKIAVYGEWCGVGIQKGVGVSQLSKRFIVFAVRLIRGDQETWLHVPDFYKWQNEDCRFWSVGNFGVNNISIDFNQPELVQNQLVELTEAVERECPVAAMFGIPNSVGEGIVWVSQDGQYRFKVKGEKHSVSKVKTLASVDVERIESLNHFVEYAVTEQRVEQAVTTLSETMQVDQSKTGDVIRWVFNDIVKEESDVLAENGLTSKDIGGVVAKRAKTIFFNKFL